MKNSNLRLILGIVGGVVVVAAVYLDTLRKKIR